MTLQQYRIHCWSEIRNEYAPSAHPLFNSPSEARTYGNEKIKHLDFIVLPE